MVSHSSVWYKNLVNIPTLLFHTHIKPICKLFQPYLQIYLQSNHFSLPCLVLTNASITSHLDYCNSFLSGPCFYPDPSTIYSVHSSQNDSLKVRTCHSSSQSPLVLMASHLTLSIRQGSYSSFRLHICQLPATFLTCFLLLAYTATATQTSMELLKDIKHFPASWFWHLLLPLPRNSFSRNLHGLFPHFLRSLFKCQLYEDIS